MARRKWSRSNRCCSETTWHFQIAVRNVDTRGEAEHLTVPPPLAIQGTPDHRFRRSAASARFASVFGASQASSLSAQEMTMVIQGAGTIQLMGSWRWSSLRLRPRRDRSIVGESVVSIVVCATVSMQMSDGDRVGRELVPRDEAGRGCAVVPLWSPGVARAVRAERVCRRCAAWGFIVTRFRGLTHPG